MSIKIMSWVFENGPSDPSERLVLLALADYASDNGEWSPSMIGIASKAGMTERGARGVIRRLEAAGWIEVQIGGGRGGRSHYRITMRNPEQETRNDKPGMTNPEHGDAKPGTKRPETRNHRSAEPSVTIIEPSERKESARGSRLSPDWFLSRELGEWALSEGMTRDEIRSEADKFRDYWIGVPGAKGRKLDWPATWRNWVRKFTADRARGNGNGNRISGPSAGGKRSDPALEQIARLAGVGATPGDGRGGVGGFGEEVGPLWMGARPQ